MPGGIGIAIATVMFNVSPFASLAEINRMLAAWGIEATGYEVARGGVENTCLIVDTQPRRRAVLRIHRPDTDARVRMARAALAHLAGFGLPVPRRVPTVSGYVVGEHQGS